MNIDRFISTEVNLAGSDWVKPQHVAEAIAEARRKKQFREQRAFCSTGSGGGIDNSCGSNEKMAADKDSGGGSSSTVSAKAAKPSPPPRRNVTPEDIANILQKISQNPDGFTLDPASGEQPPDGIMVSEYKNDSVRSVKIRVSDIGNASGADAFADWYAANVDLLAGDPSKFVGGWKTGDEFYIDVATRFEPSQAAEALEAGRKAGQLAVFNLATFKETWVKYEDGDSRKPEDWDSAYERARKDLIAKQEDGEDVDSELTKHGKSTVRAYNTSREEHRNGKHQQGRTVRRSDKGNDDRRIPSVSQVPGGVDRTPVERVVRGQSRAASEPVQGSAAVVAKGATASSRSLTSQAERGVLPTGDVLPEVEFRNSGPSCLASYSPESDTIYVSPDISEYDVDSFSELSKSGWFSQPNPILHEYAKRYHYLKSPESYSRSLSAPLASDQKSLISKGLSVYAATSVSAFVAEYVAGRLSGHAYSDQINALVSEVTDGAITL
jgi:hypothetical protein